MDRGDKVLQIERNRSMPNGEYKWPATVTKVESNYVETVSERDYNLSWLTELCKNLAQNHRTFSKVWTKNYYDFNGKIDVEQLEEKKGGGDGLGKS